MCVFRVHAYSIRGELEGDSDSLSSSDLHADMHGPTAVQALACISLQRLVREVPRSRSYTPVGRERPPTCRSAVVGLVCGDVEVSPFSS